MERAGTPFRPSPEPGLHRSHAAQPAPRRGGRCRICRVVPQQRTTGPVVLVGHSYGGVVITNAGTAAATSGPRLRRRVHPRGGRALPDSRRLRLRARRSGPDGGAGYRRLPRSSGRRRRGVPQAIDCPRCLRAGPSRARPVADRRKPASDHARREHSGDGDGGLEDHTGWAWSEPRTASSPRPRSAGWPSGPARRSPRSRDRTCQWCPILRLRSRPSSRPSPPSTLKDTGPPGQANSRRSPNPALAARRASALACVW